MLYEYILTVVLCCIKGTVSLVVGWAADESGDAVLALD